MYIIIIQDDTSQEIWGNFRLISQNNSLKGEMFVILSKTSAFIFPSKL